MSTPTNPPAIVVSAEKDEAWDLDTKEAIRFAVRGVNFQAYAGARLLRAKMKCPSRGWGAHLKKHKVARRTAHYWIECFRRFADLCNVAQMNEMVASLGDMSSKEDADAQDPEIGDEPEHNPLLRIILCKDCRRTGGKPDCPKCLKARLDFVGKGTKGGKKKRKGGSVLFSWKAYDTHLSAIYTLPDRLAKAYPDTAKSSEHHEASRLLDQLARVVEKLQKLVEGVK